MLSLPQVTLIALTSVYYDVENHKKAIEKSCEGIEWGAVKVIGDSRIKSVDDWNKVIVYDLWKYVDTEFAFLFHADGHVINPELWNPEWLTLDYIGAPWPLPSDDFSYRTPSGELVRVGNSVGLRSRKLLKLPTDLNLEWKPYFGFTHEDGFFCVHNKELFEQHGCKFATFEQALHFSKEHELPENQGLKTFAFHQAT
jgi:hypothetical protein